MKSTTKSAMTTATKPATKPAIAAAIRRRLGRPVAALAAMLALLAVGFAPPLHSQTTGDNPMLRLTTTLGAIDIELNSEAAPITAQNFIDYVESGYFDGLIFHRVIANFMIQGGGFDSTMQPRTGRPPIKNEADNGLKNVAGSLAMARTSDPDSASSQFFINLKDNTFLDHTAKTSQGWGYAVFAQVTSGMEVVEKIGAVATGQSGGHGDVPKEAVTILKAEMLAE